MSKKKWEPCHQTAPSERMSPTIEPSKRASAVTKNRGSLSPATARIVSTVFALVRRCGLFPGIEHHRPLVGCCYQGKLLRRFIGNIDYHVVLHRCGIKFLRLLNDSDVGKPSDPDLLHLTFGPRLFYPTEGIRGGLL
jgi:hypothetical protein